MTTIAVHGGIVAADTRVSSTADRRDNSNKIHVLKDPVTFRSDRVLVVGTSGNVRLSRHALQALKDDGDDFVSFYEKAAQRGTLGDKKFSLLIVGTELIHTFSYDGAESTTLKKITKGFAAIGSGAPIARFLMQSFGLPAQLAVAGASTVDAATGHLVQYVKIESGKASKLHEKHFQTKTLITKKIKEHILSSD
jgi:hypothetical protein